jgi:transposase-like protein
MGRKPRVDRTPEEKWQIIQEGMKSGNVSETCRRHGIAQTLYYRISLLLSPAFLHQALLP